MNVFTMSGDALTPVFCKDEGRELQTALEKNLNLLPGDQIEPDDPRRWLIVKREMPVPDPASGSDRWSLDFLLADQSAVPTLVECKRFLDPRSRREVVAQMLDYAANGPFYWTRDQLRDMAAEAARKDNRDLESALRELNPPEELQSPDKFFEQFWANLRKGEVRLVFFLEASSHDLRSVADFLNTQMKDADVLVVEARQYEHSGGRIIVPVLIGYTDQIRRSKRLIVDRPRLATTTLTKEEFIQRLRDGNTEDDTRLAQQLINGVEALGLAVAGLPKGVSYGIQVGGDFISILSMFTTNFGFNIPIRVASKIPQETFMKWKQDAAEFYKPETLSVPNNSGALFPRFCVLAGKNERVLTLIEAIRDEIERALGSTVAS